MKEMWYMNQCWANIQLYQIPAPNYPARIIWPADRIIKFDHNPG